MAERAGQLSLGSVLKLVGQRQILSLLLECGSRLNGAFLGQRLVDKAVLFYAEMELGEDAMAFAEGEPSPFLFEQRLQRVRRSSFERADGGQDGCVAGYLTDPWAKLKA